MKKIVLGIIGLFIFCGLQSQEIQEVNNEFAISYESLGQVELSKKVLLKDLYKIENRTATLEKLGTPLKVEYTDYTAYESWEYIYSDKRVSINNQSGYLRVESIVILPEKGSKVKIGRSPINSNVSLDKIIGFESKQRPEGQLLEVKVKSEENQTYNDIKFQVEWDNKNKHVKMIRVTFDTT